MKILSLLICTLVLAFGINVLAQKPDTVLLDIDFTKDLQEASSNGMGSFKGVLPKGLRDNFSNWNRSAASSELKEQDGKKFLRFSSSRVDGMLQFEYLLESLKNYSCSPIFTLPHILKRHR